MMMIVMIMMMIMIKIKMMMMMMAIVRTSGQHQIGSSLDSRPRGESELVPCLGQPNRHHHHHRRHFQRHNYFMHHRQIFPVPA